MKVLFEVAKVEFLLFVRDKRILFSGIALCLLLGFMLAVTQSRFVAGQQSLKKAEQTARQQWITRGSVNPHALAHYGTDIYRRATLLSLLHPGAEPYFGITAHITAHQQTNLIYRPIDDQVSVARWADISGTVLLQIVIPLLLLLLSFATIAGDREDGRWSFLLSQGVSASTVALGKLTGILAVAGCLLLPLALVVVLLLIATNQVTGGNNDLGTRLFLLFLGYAAAYLFFLTLGIAISAFARTRQTALLFSVGVWAFLCLLTPRVLTSYAERRFPTPTGDAVQQQIVADKFNFREMIKFTDRVLADAMEKYKVKDKRDLPFNAEGLQLQAGEDYANQVEDKHMKPVLRQFAIQERWVLQNGRFLTPSVPLRNLSEMLSGTDSNTLREYRFAMEQYRRDWVRQLNGYVMQSGRRETTTSKNEDSFYGPKLWTSIPEFHHAPPTLADLNSQMKNNLWLLWGWAALGVFAAVFSIHLKSGADRVLN